jgi:manganese-dependent ADP-ribose/CDP-alcohol diphosphatase
VREVCVHQFGMSDAAEEGVPPRADAAAAGGASDDGAADATGADPQLQLQPHDLGAAAPVGPPLFRFGVVADVQYADLPVGSNFLKTVTRYYRHSLDALKMAVQTWVNKDVQFVAQLGDLLDGQNGNEPGRVEAAERDLVAALAPLTPAGIPIQHAVGNHELYCWQRGSALEGNSIGIVPAGGRTYRSFAPHSGWRFIVLDAFEISTIGWPDAHPNSIEAWKLLDAHNPNDCRRRDIDLRQGMDGVAQRFMPYNGAYGPVQLQWLETELKLAGESGEKVVVITHVGVGPGSCTDDTLAWDYDEVLRLLHGAGEGVVAAVLTGHDHRGGYATTTAVGVAAGEPTVAAAEAPPAAAGGGGGGGGSSVIHHLTFRSPLETAPPDPCHAVVEVHADGCLVVHGYGRQQSFVLPLGAAAAAVAGS